MLACWVGIPDPEWSGRNPKKRNEKKRWKKLGNIVKELVLEDYGEFLLICVELVPKQHALWSVSCVVLWYQ